MILLFFWPKTNLDENFRKTAAEIWRLANYCVDVVCSVLKVYELRQRCRLPLFVIESRALDSKRRKFE